MRLLLDYPWDIDAALGYEQEPMKAISDFFNLISKTGFDPVPFIDHQARENFFKSNRFGGANRQLLIRFVKQCTRNNGGACRAAPDTAPTDLRDSWKFALKDELGELLDWRNPQIVVPESRMSKWLPHVYEAAIRCEPCNHMPESGPHDRVFTSLERYESHPYAVSDIDPWRHLEHLYPPTDDLLNKHPCCLPRPPILERTPIEDLLNLLIEVRRTGWKINGRYYFIPPADWDPSQITKEKWRAGYAFNREKIHGWKGPCPLDYNGVTWRWDKNERHWDVQTNPYISVSHNGELL